MNSGKLAHKYQIHWRNRVWLFRALTVAHRPGVPSLSLQAWCYTESLTQKADKVLSRDGCK